MNKTMKVLVVLGLIIAIGVVIAVKQQKNTHASESGTVSANAADGSHTSPAADRLPTLLDLGAGKCIPCKMMAPVLENLKEEYAGKMDVVFIDVWENPDEAGKYNIRTIPTQIFYDAAGKELFRHEGFYSKEDILAKWREFEITFESEKP